MQYRSPGKLVVLVALVVACCAVSFSQATTPRPIVTPRERVLVEPSTRQSSQVVTVVHRLNGIKALALLQRSGEAISMADDEIVKASNAVTSIIAGFALGDGQSVVTRLPQEEAEVEAEAVTLISPGYRPMTLSPSSSWGRQVAPGAPTTPMTLLRSGSAGFVVIQSDGKQSTARYVGLDSESGLSLLKITGLNIPVSNDADQSTLRVGQSVRLFAPVRVAREPSAIQTFVSMRVGEIEGKIAEITRSSTGRIIRLTIKAPNLSSAIVGGVALNTAGETIGIVEASEAGAARLIPTAAVRRAAERILTRQANVPRPYLGVRGTAGATTPLEKFYLNGWTASAAAAIKGKYGGILLTSVAPGTPAAYADLRAGDVIVRVNNFEIKNAEDFSFVLNEVGIGSTANFTVFRGQPQSPSTPPSAANLPPNVGIAPAPEAFDFKPITVPVTLAEALSPARAMRLAENYSYSFSRGPTLPVYARGIETVALSDKAATHLGAQGGLLVVFVDPESTAGKAGVHVFDVIESVDGKALGKTTWSTAVRSGSSSQLVLGIVRDQQKIEITVNKDKEK